MCRYNKNKKVGDVIIFHNNKFSDFLMYNGNLKYVATKNRKEVLFMEKSYIEYKVAEYPEQTDKGLAWVVIFKRIYL
ncbi:MAG: hypothetical protein MSA19_06305 [Butyricimonas virosa]|uniref:hypothetical protein n=1 Tax=Butyricimonas faecalis TaxID=2093856 RepID=UPI000D0BE58B|nr:hypothetical protein [Butyricimonas faecalis]MCI7162991.1 hypothetical protein [Butyricimonas virosa]